MATAGKRRIVGPSKNNNSGAPSDKVTEKSKNTEIFCSPVMGENTFIYFKKKTSNRAMPIQNVAKFHVF